MYVYIDFLFFTINEYTMFFFCLIANDLNLPSQCHSYSVIQDESRNINDIGSNACDTMFLSAPTWVRFVSQSSTTELPTSPTNPNQCGTQVTGWYAGILPTVAQTINNGQVCFSWGTNNCQWSSTISVTNCGSFYVYQLTVPPVCSARYCTTTMANSLPQCNDYETIDDPTRNVNKNQGFDADKTYFSSGPRWVRFQGTGGTEIPTSAVAEYKCGTSAPGWYSGEMPTTIHTTTNELFVTHGQVVIAITKMIFKSPIVDLITSIIWDHLHMVT